MKTKDIKTRVKEYFFLHPTIKLRVRHIERELKLPLPSVIRYTKELEQERILKRTEIANITLYSADRTSKNYLLEKKLFNIRQLHTSGLLDFLVEELSNPPIAVFGSYARGEDTEQSDIDLYIETPSKKKINIEKYEKILQRKIQLFIYKNIHELKNKDLANNILNGIRINGFMDVFT
ncbi:MAG: nucleotidyltransferase domain-containing protein [Candidatus Woesearchaeota archaeon]|nr:nucleotidyltransferase domain-containing protein [Candidatus Woesearchaeota archaeon]